MSPQPPVQIRARLIASGLAALALVGCGSSSSPRNPSTNSATTAVQTTSPPAASGTTPGPEGIPLETGKDLASPWTTLLGTPVDGIKCAPVEQLAYHIHAHLQVYVNGESKVLPGGIGILGPIEYKTGFGPFFLASHCYYWLHTHASDGVIHIESPTVRVYTLGDFFAEWNQPLSAHQVAGAKGDITAFLNGQAWTKSPRDIPLLPHAVIQLDVGTPVPFSSMSWSGTKL
ncbi:MAG: hypothetical protein JO244_03935 [Solirubrobacterales bacterium]|nr:hypothetical protein [Solirubrobacterales bacterium]